MTTVVMPLNAGMRKAKREWASPMREPLRPGKGTLYIGLGLLCLVFGTAPLRAQTPDAERITLRGFGTLAATWQHSSNDDVEYRRFVGQPNGVRSGDIELSPDSIAGAQIDLRFGGGFSATVQGLTRLRPDGDWHPEISQAYLRFSPDDSWVLRAGRLGYDIYLLAESRQVGYSYLAMRPATEVYGLLSNDSVDGADVTYTRRIGRGLVRARLFGGASANDVITAPRTNSHVEADVRGAVLDYLYRGWTARAAFVDFRYDPDPRFAPLAAALRMTGMPRATSIADGLAQDEFTSRGLQLSVVYDDGPLQAQVLYSRILSDSVSGPDVESASVQLGYRMRKWTPFVAYANSVDRDPIRDAGLPDFGELAMLNAAVVQIQNGLRGTQHTTSAGVRYDFSSRVDFKLQVDRISIKDSVLMMDRRPVRSPGDMTVIAAGVDFVF